MMNQNDKVIPLFPTPIYKSTVFNFDEVQKEIDDCISDIDFKMVPEWGSTHYLSDPTFSSSVIGEKKLDNLKHGIDIALSEYCGDLKYQYDKYDIIDSWMTLFKKNNYAHIHAHGEADLAGVYYYKTGISDNDSSFFFCTPAVGSEASIFWGEQRISMRPEEGTMLLFPGWLRHGVTTNETDDDRVSISFNLVFDKTKKKVNLYGNKKND